MSQAARDKFEDDGSERYEEGSNEYCDDGYCVIVQDIFLLALKLVRRQCRHGCEIDDVKRRMR